MCSGSETGSYLRLIDRVCHSTLGLRSNKEEEGVVRRVRRCGWFTSMVHLTATQCLGQGIAQHTHHARWNQTRHSNTAWARHYVEFAAAVGLALALRPLPQMVPQRDPVARVLLHVFCSCLVLIDCEVSRAEKMLYSWTDPESCITEYTVVYEDLRLRFSVWGLEFRVKGLVFRLEVSFGGWGVRGTDR